MDHTNAEVKVSRLAKFQAKLRKSLKRPSYNWVNAALAACAFTTIMLVLFYGDNVGLSDQSDFGRVMRASSLAHYEEDRAFLFIERYNIVLPHGRFLSNMAHVLFSTDGVDVYPSIHVLQVRLSVAANLLFNYLTSQPMYIYRIGVLGGFTAFAYAALLFWLFCEIRLWKPLLSDSKNDLPQVVQEPTVEAEIKDEAKPQTDGATEVQTKVTPDTRTVVLSKPQADAIVEPYYKDLADAQVEAQSKKIRSTTKTAGRGLRGFSRYLADICFKLLIIFVACDIGYVAYFNSFYSESLQILAFAGATAAGLRILSGRRQVWGYGLLVVFCVLFGWSKFVNLPIGVLIIAVGAVIFLIVGKATPFITSKTAAYKSKVLVIGASGVLLLTAVYFTIPDWMDFDTNYHSVFFGIIKDVEQAEAERRLQALGLSQQMSYFASTNAYMPEFRQAFYEMGFEAEFREKISKFQLLLFYLRHPSIFAEGIHMSIAHSGMVRPWYIANYGTDRFLLSARFSGWSFLRPRMGFDTVAGNMLLWLAFAAAFVSVSLAFRQGRRKWILLCLAILGAAAYALSVQIVANGEGDLAKHMFVYVQFADMAFLLLVYAVVQTVCEVGAKRVFATRHIAKAAIPALCIVVLLLPIPADAARRLPQRTTDLQHAQVGSVVQLGSFDGRDLRWIVVDMDADTKTLMLTESIAYMPFDSANSNFWVYSDIRAWLNGEFLESAFVDTQITRTPRDLILSSYYVRYARAGDRDFFAFHIPRYAFRGSERAFRMTVYDYVRLPCVQVMQALLGIGRGIGGDFWLEIPRFLDGQMPRYVARDGHVLFRPAERAGGVRPVVVVGW